MLRARDVLAEAFKVAGPVMLLMALGALLVLSQAQLRETERSVDDARASVAECRVAVERERARVDLFRELLGVSSGRKGQGGK